MKNIDERKRLFTSLIVVIRRKLNIDISPKIINYFNSLEFFYKLEDISDIKRYEIEKINYDEILLESYNKKKKKNILDIDKILFDSIDISGINCPKEYDQILDNKFISIRIKRDILNNMNKFIVFKTNKRDIVIASKCYENGFLNDVVSILNLFDTITNKSNFYKIRIFLSEEKKIITNEDEYLNADNINSGSTYPGFNITLWRKEEIRKVLIHELVHYLKLDMIKYQNKFYKLYDEINLKGSVCNPNEAYTEFLALIILNYWKFKKTNAKNFKKFLKEKLLIELGWSYFQIAKIIKFFKCYDSYKSLFGENCTFKQTTNVLSYFILKCYFLKNFKNTIDCINFNNLYQNEDLTDKLLKTVNLKDNDFSDNIDWCMNFLKKTKYKFNNLSLRMTCLD